MGTVKIVIDTSVIIATITNEAEKEKLVQVTEGTFLVAPQSLHWEIGNAFSAMLKRGRITLEQVEEALEIYEKIPIFFVDVPLSPVMSIVQKHQIYAYDAYFIVCAMIEKAPLLSLDKALIHAAHNSGIKILGVGK